MTPHASPVIVQGPGLWIGNRYVTSRRGTLRPFEAAHVLEKSEQEVHDMLRRGDLTDASSGRSRAVDPSELAALVSDRPLALEVLAALVEGRLRLPRDERDPTLYGSYRSLR
jgi:hypothetical protein